jgi:hypothetical protein
VLWFYVGRATRQQQAVYPTQQFFDIKPVTERRNHHRHRIGTVDNAIDVFLTHDIEWMGINLLATGGYANQWFSFCVTHADSISLFNIM